MQPLEPHLQQQLQHLRQQYLANLPHKLDQLALLAQDYRQQASPELFGCLYRFIHNLQGSGTSFGLSDLSNWARNLELQFKPERAPLELVVEIEHFIDLAATLLTASPPTEPSDPRPSQGLRLNPFIYLVEDDEDLAQLLACQLTGYGFEVRHFNQLAALEQALHYEQPQAIVMDLLLPDGNGATRLREIQSRRSEPLPVIFISSHDDFNHRLQAVRAGSSGYFVKPMEVHQLAGQLQKLVNPNQFEPYRVLIIEDSPTLAEYFRLILHESGINGRTETDPLKALDSIVSFQPDIVLLDLHMPFCSGQELAAIIRQHGRFVTLPILFLSAERDPQRQLSAISYGGDDFIQKPVDPKQLVAAILSRGERARQLSQLVVRDNLTGLLNHSAAKHQVEQELARARRQQQPFSVVMLDLDHFKRVNDTYGHLTGDRVLRALAALLRQRLRKSDSIGRYGGEEFLLVLPNTIPEQAQDLLEQCRISLQHMPFYERGQSFNVSFSYGIANFPSYDQSELLIEYADQALYRAKEAGRNRGYIYH